jgi:hypothetical protein
MPARASFGWRASTSGGSVPPPFTSRHFTREGTSYRCTVNMQMGALKMTSAEGVSTEIYAAFNAALERVATQLRRAKRTFRDEKGERTDKDMALREGMRPAQVDDRDTSQT